MTKSEIANTIVEARKAQQQAELPATEPMLTRNDAMDVQRLAYERLGEELVGWKVGATNEAAQQGFGIDSPFYGPIAKGAMRESGGEVKKSDCVGAVEPEYAFRMARDYPANGEAIDKDTAADAIGACHVAIEVIGRCLGGADWANGVGVTLDFGGNAAFVVGPEIAGWRDADLAETAVYAKVDGATVQSGNGKPVMGDPINSLVWLAEQLHAEGQVLKAGEYVSTGTCTAPVPARKGETVSAEFGDLGSVSVRFT